MEQRETLIKQLVEELSKEGFDVKGFLSEEGVKSDIHGLIRWWEFDEIEDADLKDELREIIKENITGIY